MDALLDGATPAGLALRLAASKLRAGDDAGLDALERYVVEEQWFRTVGDLREALKDGEAWAELEVPGRLKLALKELLATRPDGACACCDGLPVGWARCVDEASGADYYLHAASGYSQWEPPTVSPEGWEEAGEEQAGEEQAGEAEQEGEEEQEDGWTCGTCTLVNPEDAENCSACGEIRSELHRDERLARARARHEAQEAEAEAERQALREAAAAAEAAVAAEEEALAAATATAAAADSPPEAIAKWSCADCTFENEHNGPACGVCGSVRGPVPGEEPAPPPAPPPAPRPAGARPVRCESCTLENAAGEAACQACGAKLPRRARRRNKGRPPAGPPPTARATLQRLAPRWTCSLCGREQEAANAACAGCAAINPKNSPELLNLSLGSPTGALYPTVPEPSAPPAPPVMGVPVPSPAFQPAPAPSPAAAPAPAAAESEGGRSGLRRPRFWPASRRTPKAVPN